LNDQTLDVSIKLIEYFERFDRQHEA